MNASRLSQKSPAALIAALALTTTCATFSLSGCASAPGQTGEEQAEAVDALVDRTLADLYKQDPATKDTIANSVGYVVMSNKITKIPIVGAGAGYGVAIETKTGHKTYLKMTRFDIGGGWGVRAIRPVLIFTDAKVFKNVTTGHWHGQIGAEAAAKVGDSGAAGGGGSDNAGKDKGYTMRVITDAGVSATATAAVIHLKPVNLKD
jgi:hypothetical protein